jgi:hypothetical protein
VAGDAANPTMLAGAPAGGRRRRRRRRVEGIGQEAKRVP